jgi:hypothetical protein
MWHRKPKRYTVAAAMATKCWTPMRPRARVLLGLAQVAREMSRQLNHAQDNTEKPPDPWAGGNFGGAGGG